MSEDAKLRALVVATARLVLSEQQVAGAKLEHGLVAGVEDALAALEAGAKERTFGGMTVAEIAMRLERGESLYINPDSLPDHTVDDAKESWLRDRAESVTDTTPLRPCPFCGEPALLLEAEGGGYWAVQCTNVDGCGCDLQWLKGDKAGAIAAWNRRAASPDAARARELAPVIRYLSTQVRPLDATDRVNLAEAAALLRRAAGAGGEQGNPARVPRETPQDGEMLRVTVYDGKYTVIQYSSGRMDILRYGERWRDDVQDNVILALAGEVESLRRETP